MNSELRERVFPLFSTFGIKSQAAMVKGEIGDSSSSDVVVVRGAPNSAWWSCRC
jgi:hypothetical protein